MVTLSNRASGEVILEVDFWQFVAFEFWCEMSFRLCLNHLQLGLNLVLGRKRLDKDFHNVFNTKGEHFLIIWLHFLRTVPTGSLHFGKFVVKTAILGMEIC